MININTSPEFLVITPISAEIDQEIDNDGSIDNLFDTIQSLGDLLDETRYLGNGYATLDGKFLSDHLNPQSEVIGYDGRAYYLRDSACRDSLVDLLVDRQTLTFQFIGEYDQNEDGDYYMIGESLNLKETLPILPREVTHEDFGTWVELFLPTMTDNLEYKQYCTSFYYEARVGYVYSSCSIDWMLEGKPVDLNDPRIQELLPQLTKEFWADGSDLEYQLLSDYTPRLLQKWEEERFWQVH